MLTRTPLRDSVTHGVAALFRPAPHTGPPRTGIELEMLPVGAADGRPVPPRPEARDGAGTLPALERLAREAGWHAEDGGAGLPRFVLPVGGCISYEPGGQLEFATPALAHLPTLARHVDEVVRGLEREMERAGIRLLARGVDPRNPIAEAGLHLAGERYPRQRAHYDRRGPLGRVMMLQSAAVHLNVDLGPAPFESWRAANRLAPLLIALFANSPRRCGAPDAHRSQRAALWRALDPTRTGVFDAPDGTDVVAEYERFALDADSFLLGEPGRAPRPFRAWLSEGAGIEDWRRHLTTLFPEVRPRGYLEIRSLDALPARTAIIASAVAVALIHGPRARSAFLARSPRATSERLERAGRLGIADPGFRHEALWVGQQVQVGLEELGDGVTDVGLRRAVASFFDRFPARGLDPGTRTESWIGS